MASADGSLAVIPALARHVVVMAGGVVLGMLLGERRAGQRHKRQAALQSSSLVHRNIAVVTTAALPWRTGTAVNPMLRAAQLAEDQQRKVALVVPWLPPEDQHLIFPKGMRFETREEHAAFILGEARKKSGLACSETRFQVLFYESRYFPALGSLFPVEDVAQLIPRDNYDAVILEEPEHLNWFNHKSRWTDVFPHVVGIMHTNYLAYVSGGQAAGALNAAALYRLNRWTCRIHTHKVIKLSDAVQKLPHQVTCNVHGVASAFLEVGRAKAAQQQQPRFTKGAYFIGKAVWGKGYHELSDLMEQHKRLTGGCQLDVIGAGEDLEAIQADAASKGLDCSFLGAADHLEQTEYRVLVNPSTSDVVATTTAEALAMGKWVVVDDIACNAFFQQFPNCLTYRDAAGFSAALTRALTKDPSPMDDETLNKLSWEAATQRLLEAGEIRAPEWPSAAEERYTAALWRMYKSVAGFRIVQDALGMSSTTDEQPEELPSDEATSAHSTATWDDVDIDWLFSQGKPSWA